MKVMIIGNDPSGMVARALTERAIEIVQMEKVEEVPSFQKVIEIKAQEQLDYIPVLSEEVIKHPPKRKASAEELGKRKKKWAWLKAHQKQPTKSE